MMITYSSAARLLLSSLLAWPAYADAPADITMTQVEAERLRDFISQQAFRIEKLEKALSWAQARIGCS